MKRLAGVVLGLGSAIALQANALAQADSKIPTRVEELPQTQKQSIFLLVEPVVIDVNSKATNTPAAIRIYDPTRLRTISDSLRAKPDVGGSFLDNIPTDLIHTPTLPNTDASAIDFFQFPPPNPSLGININTR